MKKLNHILQSNIFLIIIMSISIILIIISTNKTKLDINSTTYTGIIEDYKIDGDKLTLQLKNKEKIIAIYYIKSKKEKEYLEKNIILGSKIKLKGSFSIPSNNSIPNTFNYKKYLKSKKIYLIMNIEEYKLTRKCNILYKIKNFIVKRITTYKQKEYYFTFILGDKQYFNPNTYDSFKTNGITHLFAISGMHISMIILILKKLRIKDPIILMILYLYSFLVLFTSSVLRVTIFYTLRKLKIFESISNEKLLIYAAIILINLNHNIIYDVCFIYSFTITLGLFLLKPKNIISLSSYAFLLSLPITIYNNYEFNIFSVFINIIVVPFVSIILYPLLLISLILPFIQNIVVFLINIFEYINLFLTKYSFNIIIRKITIIEIIIYYSIFLIYYKYKTKKLILFLFVLIILFYLLKYLDSNYYVYYLDVGQGDSQVIIYPHKNKVIMIDTGGKISYEKGSWKKKKNEYNLSDNIIIFLKSLGITKINTLIITHGDQDHAGEATHIINNFKVEEVIFNCGKANSLEKEMINVLDKKNIKYYSCIGRLDDLYFLQTKEYDNENDNSNVIYTELNGYKFMFMGDAGVEKEKDILDKYNISNIDVLKVGHHGSNTSSSEYFINRIKPKYSIISVGRNNRYGHPNKEVLNNLERSKIYRTDQDGSVMFKIKNNKLKIKIM